MKRAFSIVLALALALTMLVGSALPAGAVSEGTVFVIPFGAIGGQPDTYFVWFHNDGLLTGDDNGFIDVLFPVGTNVSAAVLLIKGSSPTQLVNYILGDPSTAVTVNFTDQVYGTKDLRIRLDEGAIINKCNYVGILVAINANPKACHYHLQVGTSSAGPYKSYDYTIFTAKISLLPGKNLISLPAYPEDTSIEVVLADLFAKQAKEAATAVPFTFSVWHWDNCAEEWLIYASDTSFSSLTTMEAGKAYWIKVNRAISFFFKGSPYPVCQGPPVVWCYCPGWAMVGPAIQGATVWASAYLSDAMLPWPAQNTYAVSTIFGFTPTATLVPEGSFYDTGWDPGQKDNGTWKADATAGDAVLNQTEGYFMYFLGEACIVAPLP